LCHLASDMKYAGAVYEARTYGSVRGMRRKPHPTRCAYRSALDDARTLFAYVKRNALWSGFLFKCDCCDAGMLKLMAFHLWCRAAA